MNNCQWSGCTEDALPGDTLCKNHRKIVNREEHEARLTIVYKNEGLTQHHDKGVDYRHGERVK